MHIGRNLLPLMTFLGMRNSLRSSMNGEESFASCLVMRNSLRSSVNGEESFASCFVMRNSMRSSVDV